MLAQRTGLGLPEKPPAGRGQRALAETCSTYNLPLQKAIEALADRGIPAIGDQMPKAIAATGKRHPQDLHEILRASQRDRRKEHSSMTDDGQIAIRLRVAT